MFWLILLDRRRPAGGSNPDHLLGVLPPSRPSQRDRSIQNHLRPPPSSTRKEISIPGGGTSGVTLSCALTSLKRESWSKRCYIASEKKKSSKFYWPSLSSDLKQIYVISSNSQREFSIHLYNSSKLAEEQPRYQLLRKQCNNNHLYVMAFIKFKILSLKYVRTP